MTRQRLLRPVLPFVDLLRIVEERLGPVLLLLLLLERPLCACMPLPRLLSFFFVGIFNLRTIPASTKKTPKKQHVFRSGDGTTAAAG